MLAIRLPEEIEARLDKLAKRTGRTKTFYARQAILEHLADLEDVYLAEQRLEELRSGHKRSVRVADTTNAYQQAAGIYRPPNPPRILFVAEAPPDSPDRYFFFEHVREKDSLWVELMKALYGNQWTETKTERTSKQRWLKKFQSSGYWLIDALKTPIAGTSRERAMNVSLHANELISEIKGIAPDQIVLIKSTVHRALYKPLKEVGLCPVNDEPLPFPGAGRQDEFQKKFADLIRRGRLSL